MIQVYPYCLRKRWYTGMVPRPKTQTGKSETLSFKASAETIERLDAMRGDMSRSAALDAALSLWLAHPSGIPLPAPADAPWSRPDAKPLEDIREIERADRRRTSRPFPPPDPVFTPPLERPERADCPHPKARVHKGLCGACGTGGL
jgi:hypothetical protein